MPNFPVISSMLIEEVMARSDWLQKKAAGDITALRALDIGCAVGRTAFEMTRLFDEVVGIDLSTRFIQVASKLTQQESILYKIPIEGEIYSFNHVDKQGLEDFQVEAEFLSQIFNPTLDRVALPLRASKDRINFWQGDACNLNPSLGKFHLIFAGNLVDRIQNPTNFLQSVGEYIHQGGFLVLISPYTWMEEYTPKDQWLGGRQRDGENVYTHETLKEILAPYFNIVKMTHNGTGYDDPIY